MSEPQHPYGTDTNAGRPAPGGAPSPVQPVPDSTAAAGARLAQLRESKGWTVEDVSARLKVSVSKLRALEAGDVSRMPDVTFALGVVRSYAKMLGADAGPYTQALRRERGMPQPDLTMPASAGTDLPRGRVSLSLGGGAPRRRSWLWGIAAIIVAVIALAMWRTNLSDSSAWLARLKAVASSATGGRQGAASSATVTEGQTAGAVPASAAAQGDDQNAQGGDESAAPPADQAGSGAGATEQSASSAEAAPPQAPATGASSAATAAATAAPRASTAASAPAAAARTASAAAGASDSSVAGTSTFAIHATQDTWVGVSQKDGKEVFSGLVHAGDAHDITGVAPLRITVGNKAGVDSMTFDGQPVDPSKYASERGNVARFVLP